MQMSDAARQALCGKEDWNFHYGLNGLHIDMNIKEELRILLNDISYSHL